MTTITQTPPKALRTQRRWPSRREWRENLTGYLFFAPWMVNLILLNFVPIGAAVYYSFTQYSVLQEPRWIGLGNYHEMFFVDELFWKAIYNTVYYCIFAVPLGLALSLLLAVMLNYQIRGISFFRATFFLPSIVPTVAASIVWAWILHPEYGLINDMLGRVGLPGPPWLTSEVWSKPAFILMSLWGIGPTTIIFLAGLQDIPEHLYEAAEIDGAGSWARFWNVTVPMLSPVILFNFVMQIIGSFQVFTVGYIMTAGGPAFATLFYVLYLFRNAFQYFEMGYAASLAWVLFLIIFGLSLLIFRSSGRSVYYEGGE